MPRKPTHPGDLPGAGGGERPRNPKPTASRMARGEWLENSRAPALKVARDAKPAAPRTRAPPLSRRSAMPSRLPREPARPLQRRPARSSPLPRKPVRPRSKGDPPGQARCLENPRAPAPKPTHPAKPPHPGADPRRPRDTPPPTRRGTAAVIGGTADVTGRHGGPGRPARRLRGGRPGARVTFAAALSPDVLARRGAIGDDVGARLWVWLPSPASTLCMCSQVATV